MMESSDDDVNMPQLVTEYYFVDENGTPISFTVLPVCHEKSGKLGVDNRRVFLCGAAYSGREKVFVEVISWKLKLQDAEPEIAVFRKGTKWINLRKPRNSYMDIIRTEMVTIEWLHFLKRTPEASEKSLWDHLYKVFSSFEIRPSKNDLRKHVSLIKIFAETDEVLATSQLLSMFVEEELRKELSFPVVFRSDSVAKEAFSAYGSEVVEGTKDADGDEPKEETELFGSVCAICDDGGDVLCCEGSCLRSFHATQDTGIDSDCVTLGYTRVEVEGIPNFFCMNCRYKRHQCFACGKLGSSDTLAGAEVFPCASATCGHFYHPNCVAQLLFRENEEAAREFQKKVAAGESYICPCHKCIVCREGENKKVDELQFAICMRCPRSYHRKCLPGMIAFEEDEEKGIVRRAWHGLLPNRILIYCMKHKIDRELGTPVRNHILFPTVLENRKKKTFVTKMQDTHDRPVEGISVKPQKLIIKFSGVQGGRSVRTNTKQVQLIEKVKPQSESTFSNLQNVPSRDRMQNSKTLVSATPRKKKLVQSSFPEIDSETEKRIRAVVDKVSSSKTLEDVRKKYTMPSTHAIHSSYKDKNFTMGKVEASVKAIRTALYHLENGGSIDEAKAICEPGVLQQIPKWRKKLSVYLSPFLHGARYSSFGRHFTKVDKLKEIVDKLHWYVQNGDTIVDFCCGSNDFSILMKEKLDASGKKCSFKNYDLIRPKNDFNFETRDWMAVQPEELLNGSDLIMGLNPPFGVQASLANKFIDKALKFQPKLLILIVPEETQRLDKKHPPYDLIWEDREKLAGKSFYLPGSFDTNDKEIEQWNVKAPPLYLWSRCDWTLKHKEIALKRHHISETQRENPYGNLPVDINSHDDNIFKREIASEDTELRRRSNKREPQQDLEACERTEFDDLSDMSLLPADNHVCKRPFEAPGTEISHNFQGGISMGLPESQFVLPSYQRSFASGPLLAYPQWGVSHMGLPELPANQGNFAPHLPPPFLYGGESYMGYLDSQSADLPPDLGNSSSNMQPTNPSLGHQSYNWFNYKC